tara:strand:- start:201 stop:533 length:333 start_codon:yes stop_codon:yes gene_type:complete
MLSSEAIFLAITVSSIATYFCRSLGVIFSSKLKEDSWIFDWIKCVSIGIIVAVISKIILFPEGILENTSITARGSSTLILVAIYYLITKNILISVTLSTALFTILNYYNI